MSIASTTCEVFNAIPAPVSSYPANDHPAADAWARHAGALAAWTERHLVNRRDAFGRYIAIERRAGRRTASTDKAELTRTVLERHYQGRSTGDLIGLHAIVRAEGEAAACRSRWLGVDIDRHDETVDPEATWRAARAWYDRALGLGFRPLLLDSNGDGGYHLVLIFAEPVPTERVFTFGQRLVRDWKDLGLVKAPEIFPKQASIQPGEFGNWLRLPGRHHTRHHYTRVWDGQSWLEGEAAIQALLDTTGSAATLIPAEVLESRRVERRDEMMEWFAAVTNRDRDLELARQALEHLDPMADGYNDWIKVGMCLRALGDAGLALWDEWSRQSAKYEEGVCSQKWETFSEDGGLTLGTLFYLAKQDGWEGPRPEIVISTREHEVIDRAVDALADDPTVYQRSHMLVTVRRDRVKDRGIGRPPGTPQIVPLPHPRLRELLTKNAKWMKPHKTKAGETKKAAAHPPDWAVAGVAARGEWSAIRPIEAVVETPMLRPDGTILDVLGWDERTWLLYEPNADFPAIPAHPTRDDARQAAEDLLSLVCDFPFAGAAHRAAWLAALLTPLARFAIDGVCPLFLFDANTPGSGKSKLTDIIAIVSTGRDMPRTAYPDGDEEMRKRITAVAMVGDRLMLIDNIATTFGGSALDSALTARTWRDRILGRSEMTAELPLITTWYASGNNVGLKGDAVRRVVPCRLETREERPEERRDFTIKGDLLRYVRRERPRLVVAALTVLRAHTLAGRPAGGLIPLGSFEAWSAVVRSAVSWAIGLDPCGTREGLRDSDPESLARAALVAGWAELPGGASGLTAAEALDLLKHPDHSAQFSTLRTIMRDWAQTGSLPSSQAVGMRLKALKDRVVNGQALRSVSRNGVQVWRVEDLPR